MSSTYDNLSFRPITRQDLRLLHEWIQRPHVAQWWAEPRTIEDIEREYLPCIEGRSSTEAYIALVGAEPIGFIQVYVASGSQDGWWQGEDDPGTRGIDQFLANAGRLDRGLGTAMIRAFVTNLFEDPAVTRVQSDPSPANARAIRCYAKAGFICIGEVATPDGPAMLMRRERRADALVGQQHDADGS